jgi:hypothetical protein
MTTYSLVPLNLQNNSEEFHLAWRGATTVKVDPSGVTLYGTLNGVEVSKIHKLNDIIVSALPSTGSSNELLYLMTDNHWYHWDSAAEEWVVIGLEWLKIVGFSDLDAAVQERLSKLDASGVYTGPLPTQLNEINAKAANLNSSGIYTGSLPTQLTNLNNKTQGLSTLGVLPWGKLGDDQHTVPLNGFDPHLDSIVAPGEYQVLTTTGQYDYTVQSTTSSDFAYAEIAGGSIWMWMPANVDPNTTVWMSGGILENPNVLTFSIVLGDPSYPRIPCTPVGMEVVQYLSSAAIKIPITGDYSGYNTSQTYGFIQIISHRRNIQLRSHDMTCYNMSAYQMTLGTDDLGSKVANLSSDGKLPWTKLSTGQNTIKLTDFDASGFEHGVSSVVGGAGIDVSGSGVATVSLSPHIDASSIHLDTATEPCTLKLTNGQIIQNFGQDHQSSLEFSVMRDAHEGAVQGTSMTWTDAGFTFRRKFNDNTTTDVARFTYDGGNNYTYHARLDGNDVWNWRVVATKKSMLNPYESATLTPGLGNIYSIRREQSNTPGFATNWVDIIYYTASPPSIVDYLTNYLPLLIRINVLGQDLELTTARKTMEAGSVSTGLTYLRVRVNDWQEMGPLAGTTSGTFTWDQSDVYLTFISDSTPIYSPVFPTGITVTRGGRGLKLADPTTGATNDPLANIDPSSNYTGPVTISQVTGLTAALAAVPAGQVQPDWTVTDTASKAFIANKPTNVSSFTNDSGYLTSSSLTTLNNKTANLSGSGTLPYGSLTSVPTAFNTSHINVQSSAPAGPSMGDIYYTSSGNDLWIYGSSWWRINDYNSLSNKPANVSTFTNDSGYLTNSSLTTLNSKTANLSGSGTLPYGSLTSVPTNFQTNHLNTQATAPSGVKGDTYYNSTSNSLWTHNGTTWIRADDYTNLTNRPTNVSAFTNDSGYLVSSALTTLNSKTANLSGTSTFPYGSLTSVPTDFQTNHVNTQATAPSGVKGDTYYNSTSNSLWTHNGTTWIRADDYTNLINKPTIPAATTVNTLSGAVVLAAGTNVGLATVGQTLTLSATTDSAVTNKIQQLTSTGTLPYTAVTGAPSIPAATTVNTLSGAVILAAGTNASLATVGQTLTLSATTDSAVTNKIQQLTNTGTLPYTAVTGAPSIPAATTVNTLSGAVILAAGTNASLATVGQTLTLSATTDSAVTNKIQQLTSSGTLPYGALTSVPPNFQTNHVLTQGTAPTGAIKGDVYFDSSLNQLYTHNGTAWTQVAAGSVDWGAITGKPSTFTPSTHNHDLLYAPIGAMTRSLCDASYQPIASYFTAGKVRTGTSFPSSPAPGDVFYNTSTDVLSIYKSSIGWLTIFAGAVYWSDLLSKPLTFTTGQIQASYSSGSPPSSPAVGTCFVASDNGKLYIWNGSSWKVIETTTWDNIAGTQSNLLLSNFGGTIPGSRVSDLTTILNTKMDNGFIIRPAQLNLGVTADVPWTGDGTNNIGDIWFHKGENILKVHDKDHINRAIAFRDIIVDPVPKGNVVVSQYNPNWFSPTSYWNVTAAFDIPTETDPLIRYTLFYVNTSIRQGFIDRGQSYSSENWWRHIRLYKKLYDQAGVPYDPADDPERFRNAELNYLETRGPYSGKNARLRVQIDPNVIAARSGAERPTLASVMDGYVIIVRHNQQTVFTDSMVLSWITNYACSLVRLTIQPANPDDPGGVEGPHLIPSFDDLSVWLTGVRRLGYEGTLDALGIPTTTSSVPLATGTSNGNSDSLPVKVSATSTLIATQKADGTLEYVPVFSNNSHAFSAFERVWLASYNDLYNPRGSNCTYLVDKNKYCSFFPMDSNLGIFTYLYYFNPPLQSTCTTVSTLPKSRFSIFTNTPADRLLGVELDASGTWGVYPYLFALLPALGYKKVKVINSDTVQLMPASSYPAEISGTWGPINSAGQLWPCTTIFEYYGSGYDSLLFKLFQFSFMWVKYGHVAISDVSNSFLTKPGTDGDATTANSLHKFWVTNIYNNRSTYNSLYRKTNTRVDGTKIFAGVTYSFSIFYNTPTDTELLTYISSTEIAKLTSQIY